MLYMVTLTPKSRNKQHLHTVVVFRDAESSKQAIEQAMNNDVMKSLKDSGEYLRPQAEEPALEKLYFY